MRTFKILLAPDAPLGGSPVFPQGVPASTLSAPPPAPTTTAPPSNTPTTSGADVSMDDFFAAQGLPVEAAPAVQQVKTPPVAQPQTQPVTQPVAPVVQSTAPVAPVVEPAPIQFNLDAQQQPQTQPQPLKQGERDYSAFTAEEAEVFKRTSNAAFDRIATIYKEHKTLKDTLATKDAELATAKATPNVDALYQHERSYMLTDEYNQLTTLQPRINFEVNYWTKQLSALRSGTKPKSLGINQQTGQYFEGQEMNADGNTEAYILTQIQEANNIKNSINNGLQQMATNSKSLAANNAGAMEQVNAQFFPHLAKDDAPLRIKYKDALVNVVKALPPAFRANPMAKTLAYAYATLLEMSVQLKEAKDKVSLQATAPVVQTTQPTITAVNGLQPTGQTTNAADDDLMSQFAAATRKR